MPALAPVSSSGPGPAAANPQQHGIDYYRSTADDDAAILEERRMRNYEEKQRKKEQKKFNKMFGQWNPQAPHKPERYSNLRAYRASGGYQRKKEGFNAFLRGAAAQYRSRNESEPLNGSHSASSSSPAPAAVPTRPSFAPPASYDDAPAMPPSDQSGEDAYACRMQLSQPQPNSASSPSAHEPVPGYPPPPPSATNDYTPPPPPPPPATSVPTSSTYQGATIAAPPIRYANATISAPPVRYERPDVPMEDPDDDPTPEERPSKRPKISKAEAMMAKMGYKKGQGLGKNNDGVVTHLEVKMRKVPQGTSTFDDEGGKVKSQQVWDVRGGARNQKDEPGKFGEESSVVVTWGCVDGVDWDANADRNDGGIRQDMGEAFSNKVGLGGGGGGGRWGGLGCQRCSQRRVFPSCNGCGVFQHDPPPPPPPPRKTRTVFGFWVSRILTSRKFGPVEHVQLDEKNKDGVVYIHFQSVLSALNAVNRFDEGWEFRGRKIRAKYYDERKFHAGIYDY